MLAQQIADQHPAKVGADGKPLSDAESAANARSFRDFMQKVRNGQKVRNSDILAFTKLFDSELTLDNLDAKQLEAMCRLLDIKVRHSYAPQHAQHTRRSYAPQHASSWCSMLNSSSRSVLSSACACWSTFAHLQGLR